jgi:predicted nucleic acid-binding protein
MAITVDASAAAAWLLPDEASAATDQLYQQAAGDAQVLQAPALWAWETGNLLWMACRRGRIDEARLDKALRILGAAQVRLEAPPDEVRQRATLAHARRSGLSFYDASYLEQALRTRAQLATKDARLRRAAQQAGVPCITL